MIISYSGDSWIIVHLFQRRTRGTKNVLYVIIYYYVKKIHLLHLLLLHTSNIKYIVMNVMKENNLKIKYTNSEFFTVQESQLFPSLSLCVGPMQQITDFCEFI